MCYLTSNENRGKNMSFVIKDDDVLDKYNEIGTRLKRPKNDQKTGSYFAWVKQKYDLFTTFCYHY